jgi:hypothetical protein
VVNIYLSTIKNVTLKNNFKIYIEKINRPRRSLLPPMYSIALYAFARKHKIDPPKALSFTANEHSKAL